MADIGKVTPSSRITPRIPQEPHEHLPGKGQHDNREEKPTDDTLQEQPEQITEERDDENNNGGIDVYV